MVHNFSVRSSEALLRASSHWDTQRKSGRLKGDEESQGLTVAVSREVGARGTSIAREIGRQLNWLVYDHELLEAIAGDMEVRVSLVESIDEKGTNWLEECLRGLSSPEAVNHTSYFGRLMETVFSLARHGECVIVGRGAAQALSPKTTLRVRFVASLEDRIEVIGRQLNLSHRDAARHVANLERERTKFVKEHFRVDPSDPAIYDMVLNTSTLAEDECGAIVAEAVRRRQNRAHADSQQS